MKRLRLVAASFVLLLLASVAMPVVIRAAPLPQADIDAINTDTVELVTNVPGQACGAVGNTTASGTVAAGSNIYILGDSITVRTAPEYTAAFKDMKVSFSAEEGRSWASAGNGKGVGTLGAASTAADTDAAAIGGADAIIIALGTNNYYAGNPVEDVIKKIDGLNTKKAPIWWVNVANGSSYTPGVVDFNTKLAAAASGKFTVIPWDQTVDPGGDGTHNPKGVLEDGTHPTIGPGTKLLAAQVAAAVTGQATTAAPVPVASTTACSCPVNGTSDELSGATSEERAYNYFIKKGLTPAQAGGVLGNLIRESNLDPKILNTSGSGAYGIGQWLGDRLTTMRKWITSRETDPKDPDSFDGQLLFLYYESSQRDSRDNPKIKEWEGLKQVGNAPGDSEDVLLANIRAAAIYWEHNFERADDTPDGLAKRVNFGREALKKMGSNTVAGGGTTCAAGGTATSTSFDYEDTARGRKLKTTVFTPDGAGPFPIVMFAHGYEAGPDVYTRYIQAIATKGFIVVAPSFPNADGKGILPLNRADSLPKQPGDIKFVLDQVLKEPTLQGKIKADAIGLVGQSDGAIDALRVGYSGEKDGRFKAIVAVAADDISGELTNGPALLMLHGDKDSVANHDGDLNNFKKILATPKYFFTMIGADHINVVTTGTDGTPALDALTVSFLDSLLNGRADALGATADQFKDKVKQEK